LQEEPTDEKLRKYKSNWLPHAKRMKSNKMPKVMLNYRPNGRDELEGLWKHYLTRPKQVYQDLTRNEWWWWWWLLLFLLLLLLLLLLL